MFIPYDPTKKISMTFGDPDPRYGMLQQPVPRAREPFGGIAITDDPEWGDVPLEVRERRIRQCTSEPAYDALRPEDV